MLSNESSRSETPLALDKQLDLDRQSVHPQLTSLSVPCDFHNAPAIERVLLAGDPYALCAVCLAWANLLGKLLRPPGR